MVACHSTVIVSPARNVVTAPLLGAVASLGAPQGGLFCGSPTSSSLTQDVGLSSLKCAWAELAAALSSVRPAARPIKESLGMRISPSGNQKKGGGLPLCSATRDHRRVQSLALIAQLRHLR